MANEVKWIKIMTDIFDDEKIVLIESMPDAYAIITVWFKLLCLAGKQNNSGVFMLNDRIPYTEEMLATIFRMNLSTVKLALETFQRFGMVEVLDGAITIPSWGRYQSLEQMESHKEHIRKYMQDYRQRQKALADKAEEVREETAEVRKRVEYPKDFEEFWETYPRHDDKGNAYKMYQARRKDGFSPEELLNAAQNYARKCRARHTEKEYIKLGKTFLSSTTPFVDFIDKKRVEEEDPDRLPF